jgi:hypothetical protein
MPSQLVTDVRHLIRDRTDAGRPLTALEHTFLLAAIAPRTGAAGRDVVAELEDAITYGRRVLLADPPAGTDPAVVDQRRREAARRLLAAARAALDFDPFVDTYDPTAALPTADHGGRPARADIDN